MTLLYHILTKYSCLGYGYIIFESGTTKIDKSVFNMVTYIESILPTLNMLAKKSLSKIKIVQENNKINIYADKQQITEVIYNFVDNAVKYGSKKQTITIRISEDKKGFVRIEVIDEGKGVTDQQKEKLFKKFVQLEPSLSRSQEGTGLGLYICKIIIEKMGGKIGVESKKGEGSNFYFILPIK